MFVSAVNSVYVLACQVAQSCPTLCDPMDCSPPGSSVHGIFPGKNTGAGCHALFQGIFPTQGSNPRLLRLLQRQAGSLALAPTSMHVSPPSQPPRSPRPSGSSQNTELSSPCVQQLVGGSGAYAAVERQIQPLSAGSPWAVEGPSPFKGSVVPAVRPSHPEDPSPHPGGGGRRWVTP